MMLLALSVSALSLRGVRVMSDIEREAFEQAVTDKIGRASCRERVCNDV